MHGRDHRARAAQCPAEAGRVPDITAGHVNAGTKVLCPGGVAGQHPDRKARLGQAGDQGGAQGAPGHDDHGGDPGAGPAPARTWRRTASLMSAPPACTGSR